MINVETDINYGWFKTVDIVDAVPIEKKCYSSPWSAKEFQMFLTGRSAKSALYKTNHNNVGRTILYQDMMIGYSLYVLHNDCIQLVSLAVDPDFQRNGVGSDHLSSLKEVLVNRRNLITVDVNEQNLSAQLFFQRNGFKCNRIINKTNYDVYRMEYRK